ncbi:MAG TPA: hypothetical protein VIP11_18245 [Gemmatimonadaceae bacterium]
MDRRGRIRAHAHCDQVTYTGDWHNRDDPEIDRVTPDATKGTYPPHCMGMSEDPSNARVLRFSTSYAHRANRPSSAVI